VYNTLTNIAFDLLGVGITGTGIKNFASHSW